MKHILYGMHLPVYSMHDLLKQELGLYVAAIGHAEKLI